MDRPPLCFGAAFTVRSRSGSRYACTFVHGGAGLIVRLDDGRIARLDPDRIDWSTFAPRREAQSGLVPGDEVLVETATERLRGALLELPERAEVALRTRHGAVRRVPRERIKRLSLLFRARDLQPGDAFMVRSNSGSEYRGHVLEASADHARVRLEAGATVNLRLERVDMSTLLVLVPIPLPELFGAA